MKKLAPILVTAALATGCYGTYSATRALNGWNGHVTHSKLANSAIHLGLWIIPVYELAIAGDFFVFNTIEFLTDKPVFHK